MRNELSAALDFRQHIDNAREMKAPLPEPYFSTSGRYAVSWIMNGGKMVQNTCASVSILLCMSLAAALALAQGRHCENIGPILSAQCALWHAITNVPLLSWFLSPSMAWELAGAVR